MGRMTIEEFEDRIRAVCSKKGWRIELCYTGIWEVKIYSKETGELLASTGSTGLEAILGVLGIPFNECPWV